MPFFISFISGVVLFYSFLYFPFTISFISFLILIVLVLRKRHLLIPVIAVGILYAFLRYVPEQDYSYVGGKEMHVSGAFDSEAVDTASGKFMQEFHVDSATDPETDEPLEEFDDEGIKIISDTEFEVGSQYELIVEAGKDRTRLNPGGINNNDLYAYLRGVKDSKEDKKSIWMIFQKERAGLNRHITDRFSPDSAELISAITTGQRSEMSEELRDAFNSTGLAHILSISGTHFGLFSVFLFWTFRFLIKHLPYRILQKITIYVTPSQCSAILCAPFMLAYLGLSGGNIPALRAFIVISLFLIGLLIHRKGFWLNSLLFAAFVIVLWSPDALFGLSFQLSFLAVLFIGIAAEIGGAFTSATRPHTGELAEESPRRAEQQNSSAAGQQISKTAALLRYCAVALRSSLLLTLAASLGTAPLVAYHFHYFSVISPLANLFITPLIGFILLPLSLMSAFIFLLTGHFVFEPLMKTIADFTIYLVMEISHIPFADMKVPAFPAIILILLYSLAMVYFFLDRKRYILATAFVLILISVSMPFIFKKHGVSIAYLDAGQGDSAVVELSDGKTVVMDTGRTGKEVAAFLKYKGKRTLDALVLTHSHPDHSGGADYLARHFKIKELWDNGRVIYPHGFIDGINRRILERGDVIEGRGYKIYVLHPYKEFYTMAGDDYNEANNSSLVLKIECKRKSFLFAGDIEEEAEDDISHLHKWLKSDVIKIPHHGGRTSASRSFFDAVSPDVAVISVGRDNAFGHPHQEMLDMIGNAKILRTDRDGAIKITEDKSYCEIKTYRDFTYQRAKSFSEEMKNIKRLFMKW